MTAFEQYLEPARRRPEFWRFLAGLALIAVVYFASLIALIALVAALAAAGGGADAATALARADTPRSALLLLASFAGLAIAPLLAARALHGRGPGTLVGPRARFRRDFRVAFVTVLAVFAPVVVLVIAFGGVSPNLPLATWLLLLPLGLAGLALQTFAEELVFRGYILQQLAARFRSPLVWAILPSLAFGAVHYDPELPRASALIVIGSAALFGLIATDLTARRGNLGAAWGFHLANNVVAVLVLATRETLPGLALFLTPYSAADLASRPAAVALDLGLLLVAWLACRWRLRD